MKNIYIDICYIAFLKQISKSRVLGCHSLKYLLIVTFLMHKNNFFCENEKKMFSN